MCQVIIIDKMESQPVADYFRQAGVAFDLIALSAKDSRSAFSIAAEANALARRPEAVILINFHLVNPAEPGFYFGIEILKEIRANRLYAVPSHIQHCHVVLFSLFSLEHLLKRIHPGFFLLASPGTTLVQLPLSPGFALDLKQLAEQRIKDLHELKPYFKVSDTTVEERHGHANWWAANRLTENLGLLFPQEAREVGLIGLLEYRNAAYRDAQFIYGVSNGEALRENRLNRFRRKFRARWGDNSAEGVASPQKIALIDDQALEIVPGFQRGWAHYYSLLLFGTDACQVIALPAQLQAAELLAMIDDSYDCILLDLMLTEADKHKRVAETSGASLLKQIKRKYPMLPVVITTASNKAEKRRQLRQLGCDAFWIKESIEEKLSMSESLDRLLELPSLVSNLSGPKFSLLKRSMSSLRALQAGKNWWESKIWRSSFTGEVYQSHVEPERVFGKLEQSLLLVRTFLQNRLLGEGYRTHLEENFWLSGVVIKLATVIENIHGEEADEITTRLLRERGDYLGAALYNLRHLAAHYRESEPVDFDFLDAFMKAFFAYLSVPPPGFSGRRRAPSCRTLVDMLTIVEEEDAYNRFFRAF